MVTACTKQPGGWIWAVSFPHFNMSWRVFLPDTKELLRHLAPSCGHLCFNRSSTWGHSVASIPYKTYLLLIQNNAALESVCLHHSRHEHMFWDWSFRVKKWPKERGKQDNEDSQRSPQEIKLCLRTECSKLFYLERKGLWPPVGRSHQLCPHSEETLSGSSHWPKKGLGNHSWLRDWPPPLQFRGSSTLHRDRKAAAPPASEVDHTTQSLPTLCQKSQNHQAALWELCQLRLCQQQLRVPVSQSQQHVCY